MAYPHKVDTRGIEDILDKILELKEGQTLRLAQESIDAMSRLRHKIYAWLHQNRIKTEYKITRPIPTQLLILRRARIQPSIYLNGPPQQVKEAIVKLIEIDDEDEVLIEIRKHLPKEVWVETHEEWRRMKFGKEPITSGEG